ncbi:hypothetical protein BHE74_00030793 [Ensete ventricosum]|nr:hypothetical protein BHE74_00030793 [Ensete ventricosum]
MTNRATGQLMVKAVRAKKSLQKLAALKEEKKAAALAAGLDWQSDSDDEIPRKAKQEPPLPDLLKDVEHHQFILDVGTFLCKALVSVQRYWEALEIINHTLRLEYNTISTEKKEEFRSLGAHIAYSTRDPKHGYNYVRYIVQQHPRSIAAWNCYYKVIHWATFQEALYNIARAYQHVGLVTLAAIYYEKVLAMQENDYPIPKLPYEDSSVPVTMKPGYCNLHREAAYNLHLIYKKSGATDLARQLLKNYCSI